MKTKESKKRPVGRPATGTTKVNVNISMPIEMSEKLVVYAGKKGISKSAVVVELLKSIL